MAKWAWACATNYKTPRARAYRNKRDIYSKHYNDEDVSWDFGKRMLCNAIGFFEAGVKYFTGTSHHILKKTVSLHHR